MTKRDDRYLPLVHKGIAVGAYFLHPSDPSWPIKMPSRIDARGSAPRSYRSAPLVPQSALFLRCKNEGLSMDARERNGSYYSGHSKSTEARRKDMQKDSTASRAHRPNSETDSFGLQISPKSLDDHKKSYCDTSTTQGVKLELKSDCLSQSPKQFTKLAPHSRNTVNIFRDLVRLSREVEDLSEVQRKEEVNTQTYKEISATLESISASATTTTTIAPHLSRSLLAQADCKKVIEEKEKIMQTIWTDAVEAFVTDVTRKIDIGLQAALTSIKQEARHVGYSIPGRSHKRQRDEDDTVHLQEREKIKKKDNDTSSEAILREHKRRRVAELGLQDNKVSLDEINDMKLKIEQQAQLLSLLAQENNELRVTLGIE